MKALTMAQVFLMTEAAREDPAKKARTVDYRIEEDGSIDYRYYINRAHEMRAEYARSLVSKLWRRLRG
ncbi:RSP_7527 family protein [Hahella chejuensis]|uniref:RSP_7527 family protein n=1 Tax=Hahella chejuensis TaxID=158327 RepID=UPI00030B424A|nr:hypothetical protein [Hahella chejuensis]